MLFDTLFSVNYEDAKGPEYLSLQPMYVSASDCLNQHFSKSNPHLNVKSQTPIFSQTRVHRNNLGKPKTNLHVDAIRYVQRSVSSEMLDKPNNKRSNRPKSTATSYFDSDLNF